MTEQETKEKVEKFRNEIMMVAIKYGVKHFSYCGNIEESFLGVVGADLESYGDFFESAMLVGRLYQSSREKVKQAFNEFER